MDSTKQVEDFDEPKQDCSPVSYDRAAHHLNCMATDCEWRAEEVFQCMATLRTELEESAHARSVSAHLFSALTSLLDMIERLPWHVRLSVYGEHAKRIGLLPGTLPPEMTAAREAICKAHRSSDWPSA
jgi:hypothetical protein